MVFIVSEILQHIPKNMESSPGNVCSIPSFPAVLSSIFLLRSFSCVSVKWSVVFGGVSVNAWQPAAMKLCISVFHFSQQKDCTCTMFCSVSGWGKPEPGYPASPAALRCWVGEEVPTSVQAPAAIQCTSSSYPCRWHTSSWEILLVTVLFVLVAIANGPTPTSISMEFHMEINRRGL